MDAPVHSVWNLFRNVSNTTFINNAGLPYFTIKCQILYSWYHWNGISDHNAASFSIYYSMCLCFYWTIKMYSLVFSVKMFYCWGQGHFCHVHQDLCHFFFLYKYIVHFLQLICLWGRKYCPFCNNGDASKSADTGRNSVSLLRNGWSYCPTLYSLRQWVHIQHVHEHIHDFH